MYRTEKITLSPLKKDDAPLLFTWINNARLVHYNASYKPIHETSHQEWFEKIIRDPAVIIFGIRKTSDNKLIGTCQLHSIHPIHHSAELQIRIGDLEEQTRGYGTDAVTLLVTYGFQELNFHKIYLHVFADNMRAIRVYEKVGFQQEGLLREHAYIDGAYKDILCMGILRREYDA